MFSVAIYVILVSLCAAQNTLCVWNSIETRDHYNGEYVLGSGTQLNKPYWIKTTITCPSKTYYMMLVNDKDGDWWMLDDELQPTYIREHPYCNGQIADPTLCTQWYWWINPGQNDALPITVYNGPCPSLDCNKIRVSGTGHNKCNADFTKVNNMKNVYINGITYLYFNKETFKWYCSDTFGINECDDDDNISHFYVSSQDDEWFDISIGQSDIWRLNNGNTATFQCIGPTSQPTSDPTTSPTKSTIEITINPTSLPTKSNIGTFNPTVSPTNIGTFNPTVSPTNIPSIPPTNMPIARSTAWISTSNPSIVPTQHPSIVSTITSNPNQLPTETQQIVVTTLNNEEHSVDDDMTSLHPINEVHDKSKHNKPISDNNNVFFILGITLSIITIVVICTMIYVCCRYRKNQQLMKSKYEIDAEAHHISLASVSMPVTPTPCGIDFIAADTPNLNALNGTTIRYGESNDFVTKGADVDVEMVNETDKEGNITDGDDELYSPVSPNQITIGGSQNDLLDYVRNEDDITPTKGGDKEDDNEIYAMPNGVDDQDLLSEIETENVEENDDNFYKD